MNNRITGDTIKRLRLKNGLTQAELAAKIGVSSKAVSKWETGKGLPDITLLDPLANALSVSLIELVTGDFVVNKNLSSNLMRLKYAVCPVCGNIIRTMGDVVISCHGIMLSPAPVTEMDADHHINVEKVEDEYFITVNHEMTKEHFISFIAYVTSDREQFIKLYPEGNAETRISLRGKGYLYIYCNKHGLKRCKI